MKLSFREYLDSKKKLLEAITVSPIQRSSYDVNKYCKLVVVMDGEKQTILLKPLQQVIVEWKYDNIDNPTPLSIRVEDIKAPILEEVVYTTNWKGTKLTEWLNKNTRPIMM